MKSFQIRGSDGSVRAIEGGQVATFEVEGGFARRPAPESGLLLDLRSETVLLPAAEVRRAMQGAPVQCGTAQLRRVRKGDEVVLEVTGGFARKKVTMGGLLVGTRSTSVLLPVDVVDTLLADLRKSAAQDRAQTQGDHCDQLER
jgi:hypothetical protein